MPDVRLVASWFRNHWLLLWFLVLDIGWLHPRFLGIDGRVYGAAARAWASGDDPWSAGAAGYLFAAPPPSLLASAPTLLVAPHLDGLFAIIVALVAGVVALRSLRLPLWWLLFPPLAEAIWVGNLDAAALALLLTPAKALACFAKIYAIVPLVLLRQWRALVGSAVLLVITVPLLPWEAYLRRAPEISATLADQSLNSFSAFGTWLIVPTVAALVLLGPAKAAWLAVPAVWPSTQFHYATLTLPTAGRWAALLALPMPFTVPLTVIAWAVASRWPRASSRLLIGRRPTPPDGRRGRSTIPVADSHEVSARQRSRR